MGGVIVDVHRERAIRSFKAIGVDDADRLIDPYCHKGIFFDIENGDIDADEFCRLLCELAGKDIPREKINNAWRSIIDPPLSYKLEYLLNLRKTHKVFMLSNNNSIIMDWACTPGNITPNKSLSDYFDKLYLSYEMKCTKPGHEIYKMMLEDAGINASESLFIDDSENNINAAKECGLQVCLVKNGSDWRNEVSQFCNI
jgi:haloacid dehalogenase superfamily, subfamily IA, variant 3 with third motif having DD or ED